MMNMWFIDWTSTTIFPQEKKQICGKWPNRMVQIIDGVLHSLLGEVTGLKSLELISFPVIIV